MFNFYSVGVSLDFEICKVNNAVIYITYWTVRVEMGNRG